MSPTDTHLSFSDECLGSRGGELESLLQDGLPSRGQQDDGHAVDQGGSGHDGQQDEPEPEEDVDLLVEDVQSQNAQGVVFLNRARGTEFVEGTLGYPGEDGDHGIGTIVLVHIAELEYVGTVGQEAVTEETVHHEYVYDLKKHSRVH